LNAPANLLFLLYDNENNSFTYFLGIAG